jgi:hypothetical protein
MDVELEVYEEIVNERRVWPAQSPVRGSWDGDIYKHAEALSSNGRQASRAVSRRRRVTPVC